MQEFRRSFAIHSNLRSLRRYSGLHQRYNLGSNDAHNLIEHRMWGTSALQVRTVDSLDTVAQNPTPNSVTGTDWQSDSALPLTSPLEAGTYDVQVQAAPVSSRQLAYGFSPTPNHDLVFHGGRTITNLQFANLYIGGAQSWNPSDIQAINQSLAAAMTHPRLNGVVAQYFPNQPITSQFLGSTFMGVPAPEQVSQNSLENYIGYLDQTGFFQGFNLQSTVFNFMLPEGTVLSEGNSNSLEGLGGFHGSVHVQNPNGRVDTIYYAVGVYSANYSTVTNGIPVFPQSWQNVVGTFYHELNEARTDPDVEDAIRTRDDLYLGWVSPQGEEIGDYPVTEAGMLGDVGYAFGFAPLSNGSGSVPIQLLYSNAVHGPEDPTV
jgi:hypothetical protein